MTGFEDFIKLFTMNELHDHDMYLNDLWLVQQKVIMISH
ncbi:hypothetical protein ACO22_08180 [Paracoccidioides brasiliensis]|uniref:Uncharacterized protein n=1 Tax=Paracoccidioides brasiliensis TaxID=121759 RepID=A0A1D2J2J4_PARBR|nr:hypothetical protein ACO22_08180 [Paracoccidioides brasiliensis]